MSEEDIIFEPLNLETELGYFDADFIEKVPIHSLRYLIFCELLDLYKQQPDKLGMNQDIDTEDLIKKCRQVEKYIIGKL